MAKYEISPRTMDEERDIARLIIQEHGLNPHTDVEINYSHVDSPEKWRDVCQLDLQVMHETSHEYIKKTFPSCRFSEIQVRNDIQELRDLIEREDRNGMIEKVEQTLRIILEEEYESGSKGWS